MYNLYTMYMSEYTVKEFRDNIRKALNEIDSGGRVTIRRYEKTYRLLSTNLKTVKKSGIKVVTLESFDEVSQIPEKAKVIKLTKDVEKFTKGAIKGASVSLCKVHEIPLDDRGKCLQKGCKYGK